MPEEAQKVDNLIDVGEADQKPTEINLDDKGEPEKVEAPKEEKIEVEQVESAPEKVEPKKEEKQEEKDELKEYSEGVQKRIAKLTRKMREAERQREEAVAYAQAVHGKNNEMEARLSKIDNSYVSEFENRVKTSMAAAQLALKTAIESQDVEAQVSAQKQIAALTMDEARLNSLKVANENRPKAREREVNITPQRTMAPQRSDPQAEEWAARNDWFGNDSAMTYTAFDIHKKLVEVEGYDPQSREYYEEVD